MRIPRWLQVLVTLTILVVVFWKLPGSQMLDAVCTGDARWLLPAFAATLAMLFVRHLKWHRLLHAAGIPVAEVDSLRSLLCGFALSVPTPGRIGELGRCLFLPHEVRGDILQLNILERMLDAWAVSTYAVASLMVAAFRPAGIFAFAAWLATLPLVLGLPALASAACGWKIWGAKLKQRIRAGSRPSERVPTIPFAGWALATTSLDLVIFYSLLQVFHRTNITTAVITFPWMILAGGLPIAAGGIGPREGVAALLLTRRGIPAADAVDAALLVFVFSAVLPALAGGAWMLTRKLRAKGEDNNECEGRMREAPAGD